MLFAQSPLVQKIRELQPQDFGDEKHAITDAAAYLYIPGAYGHGKLSGNFLEKRLGVAATMRNLNTLTKLVTLGRAEA